MTTTTNTFRPTFQNQQGQSQQQQQLPQQNFFSQAAYQQNRQPQPQQQQQTSQTQQVQLPEKDLLYTILCSLKRTAGEYTTAVTESNCNNVRQTFTDLLNSTLALQAQLYTVMKQANLYNTASPALRQEIDKQSRQYKQSEQQTQQFVQQQQQSVNRLIQQNVPYFAQQQAWQNTQPNRYM
jgi:spore coat protein F